jgi:dCTP deaminase
MSLLSYNELCALVEAGVITNVAPEQINGTSIDITVGDVFLKEDAAKARYPYPVIDWSQRKDWPKHGPVAMSRHVGSVIIDPGEFCLAQSQQVFNLPPNISAEYKLKSSMARNGLEHLNAGWCDPGWNGSVLTLELFNMLQFHAHRITAGDPIGQMVFFRSEPVPKNRDYAARGRYNGDKGVTGAKA